MVDKKTVVVVEVLLGYFGDVATAESAETGDSCELTLGESRGYSSREEEVIVVVGLRQKKFDWTLVG